MYRNAPHSITSGTYGLDRLRRMTQLYENSTLKQTKYFLGNYEKVIDETTGTEKEYHYLSAPSGLFAVVTRTVGGTEELNYVLTDHLGSIQTITDDDGIVESTHSYGPWGRLRNSSTWNYSTPCTLPFFGRGYTGHEHLKEFGLINMNGRLYDPVLGRMLSPDNFVQMPENSQNFNRYSYCLNNPLKYTDPSGEIILGLLKGLGDAIFSGGLEFWNWDDDYTKDAWSKADPFNPGTAGNNSARIWYGLIKTDENKDFWGRFKELISRFTWQAPQTYAGIRTAHFFNIFRDVKSVNYYGGATVVESGGKGWGAVTLGSFITGQRGIEADPSHWLFQHEYGHYIQSQRIGLGYLIDVGLSSLRSAKKAENNFDYEHSDFWTEQDANIRAYEYFNNHIDGYSDWKFHRHPIYASTKYKPYKVTQWSLPLYNFLFTPFNPLSILRSD